MSGDSSLHLRVPGRYAVQRILGRGGSATVLQVYDQALQTERALKLFHPAEDESRTTRVIERLLVEARAMARLAHPNILKVYDISLFESTPYIVMEYAAGGSLLGRLRTEGPLSPAEVGEVFVPILQALEHAHAAGVIHRDVKPHNILFSNDGTPLLADFGIALRTDIDLPSNHVIAGTRSFMPPEQRDGEPHLDVSADTYAVGRSMIASMLPRWDHLDGATTERHLRISSAWRRLLVKATHPDPAQRFKSAASLRRALQRLVLEPPTHGASNGTTTASYLRAVQEAHLQHMSASLALSQEEPKENGAATAPQPPVDDIPPPDADVWLVDDDEANVAKVVAACAEVGLRVAHAPSAEVFRRWSHAGLPSLLLLELHLPHCDARDLLDDLGGSLGATHVIVFSDVQNTELHQQCRALGAHHVLHKPIAPACLLAALEPFHAKRPLPEHHRLILQARRQALNDGDLAILGCVSLERPPDGQPANTGSQAVERVLREALGPQVVFGEWSAGAAYFLATGRTRSQIKLLLRTAFLQSLPVEIACTSVSASVGLTECALGSAREDIEAARKSADRAHALGPGSIVGTSPALRTRQQVVLVEDDPDTANGILHLLAHLGVQTVHTGLNDQLFATLDEVHPDLLLLDLGLPEGRGLDLLEAVRGHDRHQHLPIVVVTARGGAEHIDIAFDLGANDYIQKPFQPAAFTARVRRLLERGA